MSSVWENIFDADELLKISLVASVMDYGVIHCVKPQDLFNGILYDNNLKASNVVIFVLWRKNLRTLNI